MDRLLRLPEVEKTVGLRRSALYKRIAEGKFPKPVGIDGRCVGWKSSQVEAWINSLQVVGETAPARAQEARP